MLLPNCRSLRSTGRTQGHVESAMRQLAAPSLSTRNPRALLNPAGIDPMVLSGEWLIRFLNRKPALIGTLSIGGLGMALCLDNDFRVELA